MEYPKVMYYATREKSAYNLEIDKKVTSGLLDVEIANKMKEEFSHKIDLLIQMWSEAAEKKLKEKLSELCSTKEDAQPEDVLSCLERQNNLRKCKIENRGLPSYI